MTDHPLPAISNPQITTTLYYSGDIIINLRNLLTDVNLSPVFEGWRPILDTQFLFRSGKIAMSDTDESNEVHIFVDDIDNVTGNLDLHIPSMTEDDTVVLVNLPQIIDSKVLTGSALGSNFAASGFAINDLSSLTVRDNNADPAPFISKAGTAPSTYFDLFSGYKTATFPDISAATDIKVRHGYDSEIDKYEWYFGTTPRLELSDTELTIHTDTVNFDTATITNLVLAKGNLPATTVYTDQTNTFGNFSNFFRSSTLKIMNPANTFNYTFVGGAISASRLVNFPVLTADDTFAFLGITNVFSTWQKFQYSASSNAIVAYRPASAVSTATGIAFNMQNSTPSEVTYGSIVTTINSATPGAENGLMEFQTRGAGTVGTRAALNHNGAFYIGSNLRLVFMQTGLTAERIFTFPDLAGQVATQEFANIFANKQRINYASAIDALILSRAVNTVGSTTGIYFRLLDSASSDRLYGTLICGIGSNAGDNTAGAENAQLFVQLKVAGVDTNKLQLTKDSLILTGVVPRVETGSGDLDSMFIYRPVNSQGSNLINFDLQNTSSTRKNYGKIGVRSLVPTAGAEYGAFQVYLTKNTTTGVFQFQVYNDTMTLGDTNQLTLDKTGLSSNRTFTFPDSAGQLTVNTATQTLSAKTLTSPIINAGELNGTFTINTDLLLQRTAQAGVAEVLQKWTVTGATSSYFQIDNASATDGVFSPRITAYNSAGSSNSAVGLYQYINVIGTSDTADNSNAVAIFDVRRSDSGGSAIQFRRLYQFRNFTTNVFEIWLDRFNFTNKMIQNGVINIDQNTIKHSTTNAQGDLLYYDTTSAKYIRLPMGTSGQILRVSGGGNLEWGANSLAVASLDDIGDVNVTGVANGNILQYNGTNWVHSTIGTNGEANTAANVGSGAGTVFRDKTAAQLNFKTILAGSNISVTNNANDITIANTYSYTLPGTVVETDQVNTYGNFAQTFLDNTLKIRNPADTFGYTIRAAAIAANRDVSLPLLTANDTFAFIGIDNVWSVQQTFNAASGIRMRSADGASFYVTLVQPTLGANRNLNIPAITGTDTIVTESFAATLASKTLTAPIINAGTLSGTFTLPSAATTGIIFQKPTAASGGEKFFTFNVADSGTDNLSIENMTGTDGRFIGGFIFNHDASNAVAGYILGRCDPSMDTGTNPLFRIDGRRTSAALTTRPILGIGTFATDEFVFGLTYFDMTGNELRNATIASTVTGIVNANIAAGAAIASSKLDLTGANIAFVNAGNTFTSGQTISVNGQSILTLHKPINTQFTLWGIDFTALDSGSTSKTYGRIFTSLEDNTAGSEDAYLSFQYMVGGTLARRGYFYNNGLGIGASGNQIFLSTSGITADRTFTFPNADQALIGSLDSRLTDARTPTAHQNTHALDGSDPLVLKGLRVARSSISTTPVTLSETTQMIAHVDASGGARTINLPAASSKAGQIFIVQKTDSSANAVTIDGASAETINGSATYVLTAQYQTVTLLCDGANWTTTPYSVERRGKTTASGNGSTTVFNIPHGLGVTPHDVLVQCSSHNIGFTRTEDATNIIVTFASAPSSGTNNVIFHWSAVP